MNQGDAAAEVHEHVHKPSGQRRSQRRVNILKAAASQRAHKAATGGSNEIAGGKLLNVRIQKPAARAASRSTGEEPLRIIAEGREKAKGPLRRVSAGLGHAFHDNKESHNRGC